MNVIRYYVSYWEISDLYETARAVAIILAITGALIHMRTFTRKWVGETGWLATAIGAGVAGLATWYGNA